MGKIGAGERLPCIEETCRFCRNNAGCMSRFIGELVALGFATAAAQTVRAEERTLTPLK